jgi:trehalose 6-phosphate phosphatase
MYRFAMQDVPATGAVRLDGLEVHADEWALFIDIDGTLLDMAPTPDAVRVPPGLVATLTHLSENFGGAVALVTGRRIADADRFFAPLKLAVSGVHGAEARNGRDGRTALLAGPVPDDLVAAVHDVALARPGILVEHKGARCRARGPFEGHRPRLDHGAAGLPRPAADHDRRRPRR